MNECQRQRYARRRREKHRHTHTYTRARPLPYNERRTCSAVCVFCNIEFSILSNE